MSAQLPALWVDAFRAQAQIGFQSGSRLRSRVTEVGGVEAATYRFPVISPVNTTRRASQQEITPQNTGNAKPTATLDPRESFDYIDQNDLARTNVDAMRAYGENHGKAVSRQFDEDILEAIKDVTDRFSATAPPGGYYVRSGLTAAISVANSVGTAGELGHEKISQAVAKLMDEDCSGDLTIVIPSTQFEHIAGDTQLSSSDFVNGKITAAGASAFTEVYGCMPVFMPRASRQAGYGQMDANVAYVFDRMALGLAVGTIERVGIIEWIPERRSWMLGAETIAGAVPTQASGFCKINLA